LKNRPERWREPLLKNIIRGAGLWAFFKCGESGGVIYLGTQIGMEMILRHWLQRFV